MLPQVNPLPGSEHEPTIRYRDAFGRLGDCAPHMRRHVIQAFVGMLPVSRFRSYLLHPLAQVPQDRRICVLLNHKTRRGVAYKNNAQPYADTAFLNEFLHFRADIYEVPSRGRNRQCFLILIHARTLGVLCAFGKTPSPLIFIVAEGTLLLHHEGKVPVSTHHSC